MPRQAREKGVYSTYHIIQRGNERKNIFLTNEDKSYYLEILTKMKNKYNFRVCVYCLIDNHLHLVLYDNGNDISQLMKSINISYVIYFNRVYNRCGHLFQDRFKSELILDDNYLLEVSKYIHNHPVKAGMVRYPEEYEWSSYEIYAGKKKNYQRLIDKDQILSNLSHNSARAAKQYIEYVTKKEETEVAVMDIEEDLAIQQQGYEFIGTMEEARSRIKDIAVSKNSTYDEVIGDQLRRNEAIRSIRENSSLTLKQIGELFGGISESRISRILRS